MTQLLIDIGNSRIKWYFDHNMAPINAHTNPSALSHHDEKWEINLYQSWLNSETPNRCFISHVANQEKLKAAQQVIELCFPKCSLELLKPIAAKNGLALNYDPLQMGADRYAQLLGAHHLFKNKNYLLISAGTATTIDGVLAGGTHIGGIILPSDYLMRQSLHQYTAKLPLNGGKVKNQSAPNNTKDALATATQFATIGAIHQFSSSYMENKRFEILLCGGQAQEIFLALNSTQKARAHILPSLCLLGLKCGFMQIK